MRFNRVGPLLVAAGVLLLPPAAPQVRAQCNPDYPLGTIRTFNTAVNPRTVLPGDFDGDGQLDVAVVASAFSLGAADSGSVQVWRGDGAGQFTPMAPSIAGFQPFDGQAADLNGDGRIDVVTADFSSGTITTLLGTGSGTFQRRGSWPAGAAPFALALADCNGDGHLDAIVSLNAAAQATVLRGNGDGTFGASLAVLPSGNHPAGVCAADFDTDGDVDVGVIGYDSNALHVFIGNGDGTFQPPVSHSVPGSPWAVIPIDHDLDGRLDLVASSSWQLGVYLFRGVGGGAFVPAGFSSTGFTTAGLASGDFDQDGRPDVVAGLSALQRVMVLRNAGPGADPPFQATGAAMGPYAIGVAAGDFDGNGQPDVVAVDHSLHDLAFIPGACVPLSLSPTPLLTLWQAEGRPIAAGAGAQSKPAACTDEAGGAYVAWLDDRSGSVELYATHINSDGQSAAGWTPGGDPICVDPSVPGEPRIAADGLGGAIVGWSDTRTGLEQVYAMRLLSAGRDPVWQPNGTRVSSDTQSAKRLSTLASDQAGGAYFAWIDGTIGQGYVGRRDPIGAVPPGWNPAGAALGPFNPTNSYQWPRIGSMPGGGAFVTFGWTEQRCPGHDPNLCGSFSQWAVGRYLPDGSYVELATIGNQGPYISGFSDGQAGVLARYGFSGERLAHVTQSGVAWTRLLPSVSDAIPVADQGFLVAVDLSDWDDRNLYLVQLTSAGLDSNDWPFNGQSISAVPGWQGSASMISDENGGGVLAWPDGRDGTAQIFGQHVIPGGAVPLGTRDGVRLCTAPGARENFTMFPSMGRSALLVWQDTRTDAGDIYAQRIGWDAVVPIAYSVAGVEVEPGRALVRWYAPQDGGRVTVEKFGDALEWRSVARITPDGSGRLVFEDHDVVPGSRLGYRLVPSNGIATGEVWVDVPSARLGLAGALPNPSRAPVLISFSLPNAHDARLDMFDLAGRRIDTRRIGYLGPGRHVVELGGPRLRAGVYLVRLEQDSQTLVRRVFVLD